MTTLRKPLIETVSDGCYVYRITDHGIRVHPHTEAWIGYYRLGESMCELILTSFCYEKAPQKIVASIRAYEDLARKVGAA